MEQPFRWKAKVSLHNSSATLTCTMKVLNQVALNNNNKSGNINKCNEDDAFKRL